MKKNILLFLFVCLLCPPPAHSAAPRTFEMLTDKELDGLSTVSRNYYICVSGGLKTVTDADDSTVERILATYPPFIKILRQDCRVNLVLVEKYLYGLGLNPEFIHNYANTLRDDVVHFTLKEKIRMKKAALESAAEQTEEQKRQMRFDTQRNGTRDNAAEKRTIIPGITPPSGMQPPVR